MTPDMIRQLPAQFALVVRGGLSPVVARLPMAWKDRLYKRATARAAGPCSRRLHAGRGRRPDGLLATGRSPRIPSRRPAGASAPGGRRREPAESGVTAVARRCSARRAVRRAGQRATSTTMATSAPRSTGLVRTACGRSSTGLQDAVSRHSGPARRPRQPGPARSRPHRADEERAAGSAGPRSGSGSSQRGVRRARLREARSVGRASTSGWPTATTWARSSATAGNSTRPRLWELGNLWAEWTASVPAGQPSLTGALHLA